MLTLLVPGLHMGAGGVAAGIGPSQLPLVGVGQ